MPSAPWKALVYRKKYSRKLPPYYEWEEKDFLRLMLLLIGKYRGGRINSVDRIVIYRTGD